MTRTMTRITVTVAAAGLLATGLAGGYWWAQRSSPDAGKPAAPSAPSERTVLYWYDPMVPDQHFDRPGKSPFMDMQLVPRYADEVAGSGMRIDAGLQQNVGIRTAEVELGRLTPTVRVPGTLTWDLREEAVVNARVEGIVSRVLVKAPYTPVRRGQPLAALLAPVWSSALAEARALDQAQSSAARELQAAARQRLRVLGVSGGGARDGSVTLSAPGNGVVTEVLVREGQTVMAGTPLFRVNGTDTLWLEAAVPQASVAGLVPGTPVEARVSAMPGEVFRGRVEALLPQVDVASRTQQARIVLRNPDGRLAPGMFAEVALQPEAGASVPLIPTEALIATGADSRVIVMSADDAFQPVRVRTGRSGGGRTEILAGLKGGERVVVSGQFLIDSEASLSGALARLGEAAPAPASDADKPATTPAGDAAAGPHDPTMAMPAPTKRPTQTTAKSRSRTCPVQYWYDPMVPDQHFTKPGKSPFMDMQLVPKFAPGADPDCSIDDVEHADREVQR